MNANKSKIINGNKNKRINMDWPIKHKTRKLGMNARIQERRMKMMNEK